MNLDGEVKKGTSFGGISVYLKRFWQRLNQMRLVQFAFIHWTFLNILCVMYSLMKYFMNIYNLRYKDEYNRMLVGEAHCLMVDEEMK